MFHQSQSMMSNKYSQTKDLQKICRMLYLTKRKGYIEVNQEYEKQKVLKDVKTTGLRGFYNANWFIVF